MREASRRPVHCPQYWPKVGGIEERCAISLQELWKRQGCTMAGLGLTLFTGQQPSLERPADYRFEQGSL